MPSFQQQQAIIGTPHPMNVGKAPLLWYDPTDLNTLTFNGSDISQANNKGSLNLNITESTASFQPGHDVQQINGLATFDFSDSTKKLLSASTTGLPIIPIGG